MANPGITLGDWLSQISENGVNKALRTRFEREVAGNPFEEYYLECLDSAEAGNRELRKIGSFAECKKMVDDFDSEGVKVDFKGDVLVFSW